MIQIALLINHFVVASSIVDHVDSSAIVVEDDYSMVESELYGFENSGSLCSDSNNMIASDSDRNNWCHTDWPVKDIG